MPKIYYKEQVKVIYNKRIPIFVCKGFGMKMLKHPMPSVVPVWKISEPDNYQLRLRPGGRADCTLTPMSSASSDDMIFQTYDDS